MADKHDKTRKKVYVSDGSTRMEGVERCGGEVEGELVGDEIKKL